MAPSVLMGTKRVLVLSSYFRPDLSAGSFRATALVDALRRQEEVALHIDVISTLPNRYRSFSADAAALEEHDGLTIHRIRLPEHGGGMASQVRAYTYFARAALRLAARERYDLVVATSGRLMTAALASWISRRSGTKLFLDIRDIFVDTMAGVLPRGLAIPLTPALSQVERWTIRQASRVNLVSEGFREYFESRYPNQSFTYRTNGVDVEFLDVAAAGLSLPRAPDEPIRVVYAGNMGDGQGLHQIMPRLARRLRGRAVFRLIGDGGRRRQLEDALRAASVDNVELLPPMPRAELLQEYAAASVLFVHLNDNTAFRKVLPSKVFEYAALGKPIWAGVAGYAAEFLRERVTNTAVFPPCDDEAAVAALDRLDLRDAPRDEFVREYARDRIMGELVADMLTLLPSEAPPK